MESPYITIVSVQHIDCLSEVEMKEHLPEPTDDFACAFGENVEDPYMLGPLDSEQSFLTVLGIKASLSIIVEEAVHASTVNENILRVQDAQTPRLFACIISAILEIRVSSKLSNWEWL
jgi:hypothetical protein